MDSLRVKFRDACDVLVVGGGNAGLCAAIEAADRGAKVILIEKGPKPTRGGNSRFTYGDFRVITTGTDDIRALLDAAAVPAQQIEIEALPAEFFFGEAMRLSEGLANEMLTRLFVDRSLDTVRWMRQQGIRWTVNPELSFQRNGRMFFPRGNANIQAVGSGPGLVEMLYAIAESKKIQIHYDTAAQKLLIDEDGGVYGVVSRGADGMRQIEANGVILCCGGFQASAEKRRRYLGPNMDLVLLRGCRYNTGDWIEMTYDIGAQLTGHWSGSHVPPLSRDLKMSQEGQMVAASRYSFPYGILVNRLGQRFVDEGENFFNWTYNRYGKDIIAQPGSVAFQIFDDKSFAQVTYKDGLKTESNSLEDLAREAGINVEGFMRTVTEYNAAIPADSPPFVPYALDGLRTVGLRPDKTNWAQKLDTPPYRAFAVISGITMTYGGLKVDERARVIDTMDRPIRGLYAVGEVTGGYFYHTYLGGSGLIRGAVMGRVAAAEATALGRQA